MRNPIDVDSDGVDTSAGRAAVAAYRAVLSDRFGAQDDARCGEKTLAIGLRLKADEVVRQQRAQQLREWRQCTQHLEMRERDVQEEADRLACALRAQLLRQRNEVIVVHPDQITGCEQRREPRGKQCVGLLVGGVFLVFVAKAGEEVVKERPERAVGEAAVVTLVERLRQRNGGVAQRVAAGDLRLPGLLAAGLAIPAEPESAARAHGGEHADREPSRRRGFRERHAIGDVDQPGHQV